MNDKPEKQNRRGPRFTGPGIALGAGVGVALGVALDNVAVGVAVGVGVGLLMGVAKSRRGSSGDDV